MKLCMTSFSPLYFSLQWRLRLFPIIMPLLTGGEGRGERALTTEHCCGQSISLSVPCARLKNGAFYGYGYYRRQIGNQDNAHALHSLMDWPLNNCKCTPGRPRATCLCTVDLQPVNVGLFTACRRAQDHCTWSQLVKTVTFLDRAWRSWKWNPLVSTILPLTRSGRKRSKPL